MLRRPARTPALRCARLLAAVLVCLPLLACESAPEDVYVERPVEELYNEAMDALQEGKYADAAKVFDEVERQHPYSVWASKAQIMAGYAHYQNNAYDDAIVALDRFLQLHPSSDDAPYAHYLRALSYYEQISDVTRDQKMTELARKALTELVKRYPDSKYARDAQLKLDLTNDHLAGKEMEIGRYYLRRGEYLAAINRFRRVVDRFETTTHVPEALYRLSEAYTALGMDEESRKVAAVLGHNFPGSSWYVDGYELVEDTLTRPADERDPRPWYARPWNDPF